MMIIRSAMLAVCVLGAMACASIDVDPCSNAAIERRLGSSLVSFARSNRSDINDLKEAANFLGGESVNGAMQLAFGLQAMQRLVDGFQEDVVPEIQAIEQQCGGVEPIKSVFVDFLRDEGVNSRIVDWVENFTAQFEES